MSKGLTSMVVEVKDKIDDMEYSSENMLSKTQVDTQVLHVTQEAFCELTLQNNRANGFHC